MQTLFDAQLLEELKEEVERSACPECGQRVFIHNLQDLKSFIPEIRRGNFGCISVWCSDMGHWTGHLSDCKADRETAGTIGRTLEL